MADTNVLTLNHGAIGVPSMVPMLEAADMVPSKPVAFVVEGMVVAAEVVGMTLHVQIHLSQHQHVHQFQHPYVLPFHHLYGHQFQHLYVLQFQHLLLQHAPTNVLVVANGLYQADGTPVVILYDTPAGVDCTEATEVQVVWVPMTHAVHVEAVKKQLYLNQHQLLPVHPHHLQQGLHPHRRQRPPLPAHRLPQHLHRHHHHGHPQSITWWMYWLSTQRRLWKTIQVAQNVIWKILLLV